MTLKMVAKQSEVDLVYTRRLVQGVKTNPIYGEFTVSEAFELMLEGTTLDFARDSHTQAFAICRRESVSLEKGTANESTTTLKKDEKNMIKLRKLVGQFKQSLAGLGTAVMAASSTLGQDASSEDSLYTLSPFEVNAQPDVGYGAAGTLGGTRISTELLSTPVNVTVLNEQMMEDLNLRDFADYVTYVAGGTKTGSTRSNQTTFRGVTLGSGGTGVRDGISETNAISGASIVDTHVIQRIEFIKGPSGVLFGAHPIGGVMNRVSKRPLREDHTILGFEYNTYFNGNSSLDGTLDWNKVYGENDQMQVRLLLHQVDGDTFHGSADQFTGITPIVSYDLNEGSRVWARLSYNDQRIQEHRGTWWRDAEGNLPFGIIPVDRATGNPNDRGEGQTGTAWNYEFGYTNALDLFGLKWDSRLMFRQSEVDGNFKIYLTPNKSVVDSSGNSLGRIGRGPILWSEYQSMVQSGDAADIVIDPFIARGRDFNRKNWNLTYDLTTAFRIGESYHRLFTYVGLGDGRTRQDWYRWDYDPMGMSVFDVRGVSPDSILSNHRKEGNRPEISYGEGVNFAIQDQASLLDDRLILVGGARYDETESGRISAPEAANPNVIAAPFTTNSDWSYKYGLVGKPLSGDLKDDFSFFFNHSETFSPSAGINQIGEPLPNIRGVMDEFGAKMSFLDGKLTGTASVFTITEEGVRESVNIPDPNDPTIEIIVTRAIGTRDIKGWDLDLTWQPVESFNLYASVQDLTKGEVGARTPGSGGQARGVPVGFNYALVGRYDFLEGPLEGFYLGANARKVVERAGDFSDTFRVPGFEVYGLLAGYRAEDWRVQLNLENATDEEYVDTTVADFLIAPGAPMNARLGFYYTF